MTELAYMVGEDWRQDGTAMLQQSAVIRDWLGSPPYVFATTDRKKYESDHSADREFMTYVAPDANERHVIDLSSVRSCTSRHNAAISPTRDGTREHPGWARNPLPTFPTSQ
ncbi:MAG: hypothetical protein WBA97_05110 [Actinophytocola sp.]|uniref:hypothetical protein n=1 Tax=Actinophytocola sp. TaxID=1872138 RepID=UPI003C70D546